MRRQNLLARETGKRLSAGDIDIGTFGGIDAAGQGGRI